MRAPYRIVVVLLIAACGGGGGGADDEKSPSSSDGGTSSVDDTFRAECEVECRTSAESRECAIPGNCVDDCVAVTSGLETLCGKCVVEDTYVWKSTGDSTCTADPGSTQGDCAYVCNSSLL